jgi:hypothetical protein
VTPADGRWLRVCHGPQPTLFLVFGEPGNQAAGQRIFDLSRRKTMSHCERRILGDVVDLQGVPIVQRIARILDAQRVVLIDVVVVVGIIELERQPVGQTRCVTLTR